ncbi:hypothetical protein, partial [Enterocloster clostridioformis]|uniref:hypothetical protein n=1 Tax=Enterocloster clostridioformis TaxID=1531 RepID=UPI001A99774D
KKYPNLFCFVWLVNPEDSEKGLDIFWVWISNKIQTFGFLSSHICSSRFAKVDQRRSRSDCYAPDSLHIYGTQNSTLNRTVSAADSRSLS